MSKIFLDMTLYDLVTTYGVARTVLEANDYDIDDTLLNSIGKSITLDIALSSRQINKELFLDQLQTAIDNEGSYTDSTLKDGPTGTGKDITLQGILPCPVRIPLLEGFESWLESSDQVDKGALTYELKAASMGVDWLKDDLITSTQESDLSDIFLSAGFDLFFDHQLLEKYKEKHVFKDFSDIKTYNTDFNNDDIQLQDPKGEYAIIGVVPAVFLVNSKELGDLDPPRTWADLLKPEFENSVSLPVGDFDLFNAILLNIYKRFGEEGITALGKCFFTNLHPAEMVKSHTKTSKPKVTIMPYFFTKMAKAGGPMLAIWPEDGAIISPIFMLSKDSKKKELKPYVDFFASKEVGEILSHNGRFPSVHPEVDNQDAKGNKYMWLGWDYIEANDIGRLIEKTTHVFNGVIPLES